MNATPTQIVDALIKYLYNVSPIKVFEAVYGTGQHPTYRDEKLDAMKNLIRWWGQLDNEHQARLVNLALERYNLV